MLGFFPTNVGIFPNMNWLISRVLRGFLIVFKDIVLKTEGGGACALPLLPSSKKKPWSESRASREYFPASTWRSGCSPAEPYPPGRCLTLRQGGCGRKRPPARDEFFAFLAEKYSTKLPTGFCLFPGVLGAKPLAGVCL